jgi:hypothetical protein
MRFVLCLVAALATACTIDATGTPGPRASALSCEVQ